MIFFYGMRFFFMEKAIHYAVETRVQNAVFPAEKSKMMKMRMGPTCDE